MLPIGPLMIEHRLIERVIKFLKVRLEGIQTEGKVDPREIERTVHFIRVYADRCHHGKEEQILFHELEAKGLSTEYRQRMDELVADHKLGRQLTASLVEANERYQEGDPAALADIAANLRKLVAFYPQHIEKEDKRFFIPVMDYFSPDEKKEMIRAGYEVDSRLLHEEYADQVRDLEIKK